MVLLLPRECKFHESRDFGLVVLFRVTYPASRHWDTEGVLKNTCCKVMSLPFNMLSRLVITFLPRSKGLLISWPQAPSAVILEPTKINSDTVSTFISHEVMGLDAMIFVF